MKVNFFGVGCQINYYIATIKSFFGSWGDLFTADFTVKMELSMNLFVRILWTNGVLFSLGVVVDECWLEW
jgi:hypothetical protein